MAKAKMIEKVEEKVDTTTRLVEVSASQLLLDAKDNPRWNVPGMTPEQCREEYLKSSEFIAMSRGYDAAGVVQPIIVTPEGDKFRVIEGFSRAMWAKLKNQPLPAIVRNVNKADRRIMQTTLNVARNAWHPLAEATVYSEVVKEHAGSEETAAKRIGIPIATLRRRLRLLALPKTMQECLVHRKVTLSGVETVFTFPGYKEWVKCSTTNTASEKEIAAAEKYEEGLHHIADMLDVDNRETPADSATVIALWNAFLGGDEEGIDEEEESKEEAIKKDDKVALTAPSNKAIAQLCTALGETAAAQVLAGKDNPVAIRYMEALTYSVGDGIPEAFLTEETDEAKRLARINRDAVRHYVLLGLLAIRTAQARPKDLAKDSKLRKREGWRHFLREHAKVTDHVRALDALLVDTVKEKPEKKADTKKVSKKAASKKK